MDEAKKRKKKGKEKLKKPGYFTLRFEESLYLRFRRVCVLKEVSTAQVLQEFFTKWTEEQEKKIMAGGIEGVFQLVQND